MTEERFTYNNCIIEIGKPLMVIKDNGQPINITQIIDLLNELNQDNNALIRIIKNQSYIIEQLHTKLIEYELKEPIKLTKEDIELMGKAISYYTHGGMPR